MYGLTETAGAATASFVNDDLRKAAGLPLTPAGSCGLLVPLYEAKVRTSLKNKSKVWLISI